MRLHTVNATCPNCCTFFERIPVEYDEEGGYVVLMVIPCTGCGKLLCSACDWYKCDGCGDVFCADCLQLVDDGTDRALHCCKECVLEGEEAQQELLPLPAMVACAVCGSIEKTVQDDALYLGATQSARCEPLRAVA